ncbi:flavin reductase family protein [Pseudonocardia sp. RS010]|uniref:flavin reductase family protein n=1 Tax=Pseudonocardia sp. RS010 TaxID=3385979 RepID=UPI0039A1546B
MIDRQDPVLDAMALRRAFGCFPSGVIAVCAEVDGRPVGMTASTFVPVSLAPPLVAFCVQRTSTTWPALATAARLGVSILGADQGAIAHRLATRDDDRFAGLAIESTPDGAVLVPGATAWLRCSVHETIVAGDHSIVLLTVDDLHAQPHIEPLVFHASTFRALYHGLLNQ